MVELVVVLGISGVLLSLATLGFRSMNDNYRIESQVKQMQSDIDNLRMTAMTRKQNGALQLNPNGYSFVLYSSEGDTAGHVVKSLPSVSVQYPIQQFSAGSYSAFNSTNNNNNLTIDSRGCLTTPAAPFYIAVAPGTGTPAVNALALQTAKTNVGSIQGGSCVLQ